jgi:glycosyltransferase involved in cell wall biosynthesis
MNPPSTTHLVLIPSFNTGPVLGPTVAAALAAWQPVWVVIDGSTDGSDAAVAARARADSNLRILVRPTNGGKGAAVLTGARAARAAGFTHALVMDADGQHPADRIAEFMKASAAEPAAAIFGRPVFGPDAPRLRRQGRKLSIGLVHLETGGAVADPLFGFRVYPLSPLIAALEGTRFARRYDFDPEVAVRLVWAGTPLRHRPAACRYLTRAEGGISHFHYWRDNLRMVWLHTRLLTELLLWRWVSVRRHRRSALSSA